MQKVIDAEDVNIRILKDGTKHVRIEWVEQFVYPAEIDLSDVSEDVKGIFRDRGL